MPRPDTSSTTRTTGRLADPWAIWPIDDVHVHHRGMIGARVDGAPVVVGRGPELAALLAAYALARSGRPQVVLVEGEPGTGKSALLEAFLAGLRDRGAEAPSVVRACGEEPEELVALGIVEQLLRSAARTGDPGPAHPVRPADEAPVAGAALLALLDRLSGGDRPVVLVVDDAHWADVLSMQAIVFALRRLGADRVLVVVAHRPAGAERVARLRALAGGDGGAVLRLGGLDVGGIVELGRALGVGTLPRAAAERLRAHTGGVPLHARALLAEVDPAVLRSADRPMPAPSSYAVLVLGRLSSCPPGTRDLVAAAAVLGERCRLDDAGALAGVAAVAGIAPAVTADLIEIDRGPDGARLRFPHTLVRAAIYHDLDLTTAAALHTRAAAIVTSTDEALRHRVAAAVGADPPLAGELAAAAAAQLRRGERGRAARTLTDAARLHTDPSQRRACLAEAVELLVLAGENGAAADLAGTLEPDGPGSRTGQESYVLGLVAFVGSRMADAEQLFDAAWATTEDPELQVRIAERLCHLHYLQLRSEESVEWGRRAQAARPRQAGWLVTSRALAGQLIALPRPAEADRAGTADAGPESAVARGTQRLWTEDLLGARADLAAAVPALRTAGLFMTGLQAQGYLALARHRLGTWDAALVEAEEAISLAQDAEQGWILARLHAYAAMAHAARGNRAAADAQVRAAESAARATGLRLDQAGATIAAAHVAGARDDHAGVVALLEPLAGPVRRGHSGEPGVSTWPCLLADAYRHLGRLGDADGVLVPYRARAAELGRSLALSTAERVTGELLAARGRSDDAEQSFVAAIALAEAAGAPVERAQALTALGAHLRRCGRRRDAATRLHAARAVLIELGTGPLLAACDAELAACGLAPTRRTAADPTRLTPREQHVARLAASGLTNPEVAATLIVSVNTVEFHLRNAYAKLGIRSRADLGPHLR